MLQPITFGLLIIKIKFSTKKKVSLALTLTLISAKNSLMIYKQIYWLIYGSSSHQNVEMETRECRWHATCVEFKEFRFRFGDKRKGNFFYHDTVRRERRNCCWPSFLISQMWACLIIVQKLLLCMGDESDVKELLTRRGEINYFSILLQGVET